MSDGGANTTGSIKQEMEDESSDESCKRRINFDVVYVKDEYQRNVGGSIHDKEAAKMKKLKKAEYNKMLRDGQKFANPKTPMPLPKYKAELVKACYAAKMKPGELMTATSNSQLIVPLKDILERPFNFSKPIEKTAAERSRAYRERQKIKKSKPPAKTPAERSKEYRERKKISKKNSKSKPPAKTPAEKSKEYRERRKIKKFTEDVSKIEASTLLESPPDGFFTDDFCEPPEQKTKATLNTTDSNSSNFNLPPETGVKANENIDIMQHVTIKHENICTHNTDLMFTQSSPVGNLYATQCTMPNGINVIMVSVNISQDQSIEDVQDFMHHVLLPYTEGGSKLLKKNYHEIPMIVAGDFNIDFDNDESLLFIHFLKGSLNLEIVNDKTATSNRLHVAIDTIFLRFIDDSNIQSYISHFSHHRPIVL